MTEHVKVEIFLDKDLAEWLDAIKDELSLRSRGSLINKLLRELKDENGAHQ
jgi:metal-responsive CopG/Arc/MetJ family transcriptional regulator